MSPGWGRLASLLAAAILAGCSSRSPAGDASGRAVPVLATSGQPEDLTYAPSLSVDLSLMTRTASGLYYQDLLVGRGGAELDLQIDAFPYLSVLPAGTIAPNPQELISHDAFRMTLDVMSSRFDVVLIDVPAYTTAADALVVAARVGGILLVARKDKTRLADIAAINTQLARNGIQIVGSVLIDF